MFNVEIPRPENGAAYQILFERTHPAYCTTRERQAEIKAEFDHVLVWAASQPPEVNAAYTWAVALILRDVEANIARNDLASGVQHHLQTTPRPPEVQK